LDEEDKRPEEARAQPAQPKFVSQVKRAARPNLPTGILQDIERMKQKMTGEASKD